MSPPTDVCVLLVTAPDSESAERLATTVVEERLAACANLIPGVASVYEWQGKTERASEVLMILKTTAGGVAALEQRIVALHPYDVPEVLTLEVARGHGPYLDWVRAGVGA